MLFSTTINLDMSIELIKDVSHFTVIIRLIWLGPHFFPNKPRQEEYLKAQDRRKPATIPKIDRKKGSSKKLKPLTVVCRRSESNRLGHEARRILSQFHSHFHNVGRALSIGRLPFSIKDSPYF